MPSDEEEDYMSDKFLSQCLQKDVRPGLIHDRKRQREVEVESRKVRKDEENKKSKLNAKERLHEGLSSALSQENKGFAMLAKMGYKQGQALGKISRGIVEPIPITVKSDRSGLGREAAVRELAERKQELHRKRLLEKAKVPKITLEEHRQRMMQKAKDSFIERALRRLQITCEELDEKEEVNAPEMPWFWPERPKVNESDDDQIIKEEQEQGEEQQQYEPVEKLELLSLYLRTSYNYCHWCGVQYRDVDDLAENCPGRNEEDH